MGFYDYKVKTRDGEKLDLRMLKGKVVLVVNTATGCGFTPQYEALETLYEKYHDKGLEILDFPCDQFGHQAPGTDEEIRTFCVKNYKTQFEQLAKVEVNGDKEEPLFTFFKEQQPEDTVSGTGRKLKMAAISKISKTFMQPKDIKWNFTKFLVNREGEVCSALAQIINQKILRRRLKNGFI